MKVSVIVPFVNEYPQLIFTLQSIAQDLKGRMDFEVLAVDNWCKEVSEQTYTIETLDKGAAKMKRIRDRGSDMIKSFSKHNPWLVYVEYTDKLSHWQSKNYAAQKATGDVLWFCDAHCVVGRNSLFDMAVYYDTNYNYLNGSIHLPLTYHILETHRLVYKIVCNQDKGELTYSFTGLRNEHLPFYEVPCMSTCGMMVSKEIYNHLGGWPKELGIYSGGEHFFNYVSAILGYKKFIFTSGTLFHHGEKRGYSWNYDDSVRNRFIANYMFGGKNWLELMKRNTRGNANVLQGIADNVVSTCGQHRQYIKNNQKITIEEWLRDWI